MSKKRRVRMLRRAKAYVRFRERGLAVAIVWSWKLRSRLWARTLSYCHALLAP